MNATNAAYIVISQNPDNGMDCIDEFAASSKRRTSRKSSAGKWLTPATTSARDCSTAGSTAGSPNQKPATRVANFAGIPATVL